MSAYVIVEATVRDADARDRYAAQVQPILRQFGAEILVMAPWQVLFGEAAFSNGMVVRFEDKDAALAWYHSPEYQAIIALRTEGMDCRFRLLA